MNKKRIVVIGGGAAGFFAAITCAESIQQADVMILEQGSYFLTKVRISGGGRCNVTHACFDALELSGNYPRGERALVGAFRRFQPRDVIAWFEARGVKLKTEMDGRVFPASNSSETIIQCLIDAARNAGVRMMLRSDVVSVSNRPEGGFKLTLSSGDRMEADRLLLATGGCRTPQQGQLAVSLGHALEPPVPSLFGLQLKPPGLGSLAGISVDRVEVSVPETRLRERGELLITHSGLSGPVILRISAWGARLLHEMSYQFPLVLNWLPDMPPEKIAQELDFRRQSQSARLLMNLPLSPIPARLWEQLILTAGVAGTTRYADLSRSAQHGIIQQLTQSKWFVTGKSPNKSEFVTCGGIPLNEVNFKTMESRTCPGLYFAGELLDIDGLTGGFNFQSAWTTAWIAGKAMAASLCKA